MDDRVCGPLLHDRPRAVTPGPHSNHRFRTARGIARRKLEWAVPASATCAVPDMMLICQGMAEGFAAKLARLRRTI